MTGGVYLDSGAFIAFLVWLQEREIKSVGGTDHHLAVEGARVLPGSPLQ